MKPGISNDGVLRAEVSVKFRLSLDDLVYLFLARHMNECSDLRSIRRLLSRTTKAQIMTDIKDQLKSDGQFHSVYHVCDTLTTDWISETKSVFITRFPEFTPTQGQRAAIEKFGLRSQNGFASLQLLLGMVALLLALTACGSGGNSSTSGLTNSSPALTPAVTPTPQTNVFAGAQYVQAPMNDLYCRLGLVTPGVWDCSNAGTYACEHAAMPTTIKIQTDQVDFGSGYVSATYADGQFTLSTGLVFNMVWFSSDNYTEDRLTAESGGWGAVVEVGGCEMLYQDGGVI